MKLIVFITTINILFIFNFKYAFAQRTYTNASFRAINNDKYFRFHYDNDFFTAYDQYYSQGITLDLVHPVLKRNPINWLLIKPFKPKVQYGVSFNLFGFTPKSILSDSILFGDRPFNANATLKFILIQNDAIKKQLITTALSVGVMGANAKGYQIQYNIHKWLNNPLPRGWQHQIKNDVILNYQLNYEKQLYGYKNNFLLSGIAEGRVGTVNNNVAVGFCAMAGSFAKRYTPISKPTRNKEIYVYFQNKVNFVGYDATMQGGIFNKTSPYVIAAKDINRLTYQADAGIVFNLKKVYLTYTQSYLTKEFATGSSHRWGGVSVGVGL